MATRVVMEALSPTMEEGRLVSWKKKEGDAVKAGETLAEVETDKAVMDLVARGDGVLRKIILQEGATVPVSALVAIIGAPNEDISALAGDGGKGTAPAESTRPEGRARPEQVLKDSG
ncbi:MAG: lipoyl domain-containing protein, partial [Gemmatimonadales bacterium]